VQRLTTFDPTDSLIFVDVHVAGPAGRHKLKLAFDTGATFTVIKPTVAARLGYGPRDILQYTTVTSALGSEPGFLVGAKRVDALGETFDDLDVLVHDFADGSFDGLLGLNVLARLNYKVHSREGMILSERVRP
jgi:predicted aspartyl protease